MPKRIQRKRTKGWRMPEGAVYVGRPSAWGNVFRVSELAEQGSEDPRGDALHDFKLLLENDPNFVAEVKRELRGKDLACWCPLDQPCHADVLLELANAD